MILFVPYWNLNRRISKELTDFGLPPLSGYEPLLPSPIDALNRAEPSVENSALDSIIAASQYDSIYSNELHQLLQKDLAVIENLEIAKVGLPHGFDIINERDVRSLPSNDRKSVTARVVVLIPDSNYSRYYGGARDTLLVYFNQIKEQTIHSQIFEMRIRVRTIWAYNVNKHKEQLLTTYSITDPNVAEIEHFSASDIQNRLFCGKMYATLLSESMPEYLILPRITSSLSNMSEATTIKVGGWQLTFIVAFFSLVCSYCSLIACTVIKYFGLRAFILGIISLVLAIVIMGGILIFLSAEFVASSVYLAHFTILGIPMAVAILGVYLFRADRVKRAIFAQWIWYLVLPVILTGILAADDFLFSNLSDEKEFYLLSFIITYFLLSSAFMKTSYTLYCKPAK
ncbi:MAG: hypothetical protein QM762_14705 [Chryseolinea sp.]